MSLSQPLQSGAFPLSKRSLALVLGDTLAFFVFASIGRASHAEAAGLAAIGATAETAAPFLLAWLAIAPVVGAFRQERTATPQTMLTRTALGWILAWPIGLSLRALIRQSGIPLSFALITFAAVLIILGLWRSLFAALTRNREHL